MTTSSQIATAKGLNVSLVCLAIVICARLWIMPLGSSYWIDEMATVYVAHHGAQDPSLKVAPQVAESIYYVLPRMIEKVFGDSEIANRLPSVVAIAFAMFFVYRLAARLIHPEAGWFAVFACLSLRGIDYQAGDARPYALGLCVSAGSLLLLIRWLDSTRLRDGLLFLIVASLLWRVHLIYWPFYLIYPVYTLARLRARETQVEMRHAVLIFSVLGISLLPVLETAIALNHQAAAHVVVPAPSFKNLITEIKLGMIVGSFALAGLAARVFRWSHRSLVSGSSLLLIVGWWLCQQVFLFGFSWITGNSVFVPRYLYIALPGAALTATAVAAPFVPKDRWKPVSLALGAGVLLILGQWGRLWPAHHPSDWKAAAASIQKLSIDAQTPVICPSPFIEARPPAWNPNYPLPGFLYAHLAVYPIPGRVYPFPFDASPEVEQYAVRLLNDTLAESNRFVIYGWNQNVWYWRDWLSLRPELSEWSRNQPGSFGDVAVIVFERAASR